MLTISQRLLDDALWLLVSASISSTLPCYFSVSGPQTAALLVGVPPTLTARDFLPFPYSFFPLSNRISSFLPLAYIYPQPQASWHSLGVSASHRDTDSDQRFKVRTSIGRWLVSEHRTSNLGDRNICLLCLMWGHVTLCHCLLAIPLPLPPPSHSISPSPACLLHDPYQSIQEPSFTIFSCLVVCF